MTKKNHKSSNSGEKINVSSLCVSCEYSHRFLSFIYLLLYFGVPSVSHLIVCISVQRSIGNVPPLSSYIVNVYALAYLRVKMLVFLIISLYVARNSIYCIHFESTQRLDQIKIEYMYIGISKRCHRLTNG